MKQARLIARVENAVCAAAAVSMLVAVPASSVNAEPSPGRDAGPFPRSSIMLPKAKICCTQDLAGM